VLMMIIVAWNGSLRKPNLITVDIHKDRNVCITNVIRFYEYLLLLFLRL
jgi:hypothetical protein